MNATPDDSHEQPTHPLVTIDNVTVRLGDVTALTSITTSVSSGTFLGIVGPNGAGKSTLLRTITGMVSPETGTVLINGRPVSTLSSRERSRQIAVVPQETSVAFDFDVSDVIRMGRTPYLGRFSPGTQADSEAVAAAMERTDVTQFADRPISSVSGGERQRILLARAIAQDTPLLLLDEPTASLDINHQIRTLDLISTLVADGKTVIAAIHDLNLAARYCDEVLLLDAGSFVDRGPPETVLTEETVRQTFAVDSVVTTNPVTNTQHVTALSTELPED